MEAVLNYARHFLDNAARLWIEATSDQKQRLQKVLFPKGVTFANGVYGTTEMSPVFGLLQQSEYDKSDLATLPGIENGFSDAGISRENVLKLDK